MSSPEVIQNSQQASANSQPVILRAQKITKTFGQFSVLKGVDFSLRQGEFVTLLGPNGAGKTTFLRILALLARPSSGTVEIAGIPVSEAKSSIRSLVGVISHLTFLYEDLTAQENLEFYGKLYGLEGEPLQERVRELLAKVGLERRAGQRVRFFSRGMQQRLSLARAVLHRPPVLLLDEPDTGLDRQAAEMLAQIIAEPAVNNQPRSVLMITHNLERGVAMSDRLVVLAGGRIVRDLPSGQLEADQVQSWYYQAIKAK